MYDELVRNLQLANEALARYYETGDPFDGAISLFAGAKLDKMLKDAVNLPDYEPLPNGQQLQ